MSSRDSKPARGVSLIEVIFSIGVILIGLLGVMSILPLAGNRARDAVSLSTGAAIGDNVIAKLSSHRWLNNGRLVRVNELPGDGYTGDGYMEILNPTTISEPFCIDPLFVSGSGLFSFDATDPTRQVFNGTATSSHDGTSSAFNVRFFPFYNLEHNPTTDPSVSPAEQLPVPRSPMRRVGINVVMNPPFVLPAPAAFHVGDSIDDLLVQRPKDRTADIFRPGYTATQVNGGVNYGGRFATGEFSWIATVVPISGSGFANVSVVVIRNRQRQFTVPTGPAPNPERNATDERLANVTFGPGFIGGAGGVVQLSSSANTLPRLRTGDWMMLSSVGAASPIHRWYRVSSISSDPEILSDVWQREVYLDGPDWPAGTSAVATLVENVVSVTERHIQLNSL